METWRWSKNKEHNLFICQEKAGAEGWAGESHLCVHGTLNLGCFHRTPVSLSSKLRLRGRKHFLVSNRNLSFGNKKCISYLCKVSGWWTSKVEIPLPHLFFFFLFSHWQRHCLSLCHWVLTVRGNAIVPTLQIRNGGSGEKMPSCAGECDFKSGSLVHCFVHSLKTSVC